MSDAKWLPYADDVMVVPRRYWWPCPIFVQILRTAFAMVPGCRQRRATSTPRVTDQFYVCSLRPGVKSDGRVHRKTNGYRWGRVRAKQQQIIRIIIVRNVRREHQKRENNTFAHTSGDRDSSTR